MASPPNVDYDESCEFVYVCGSSMHQKCFDHALTNLFFGLCRFVWIINPLVIHLIPILELQRIFLLSKCCELRSIPKLLLLLLFSFLDLHLSLSKSVGVCHKTHKTPTETKIRCSKFAIDEILEKKIRSSNFSHHETPKNS
jgi:hypothetical protein